MNVVEVLAGGGARAARLQDRVTFRDVVRTGVKSRAELTFPDATLARVGANSVFSFRPDQRAFDLKQGCILFHSPKGKGGGQIHTAAATAAVTGTTIIVATTPNGGFKVLVLEGRARLRMANGQVSNLRAGQMAYVLPGAKRISPPLSFHLSEQVKGSDLVKGFSAPLPSIPLIDAAIIQQQVQIQQGDLNVTGFMIGEVTGDNTVNLVPVSAPIVSTTENPGSPFASAVATSTPVPPPPPSRYDYAVANDTAVAPLDPLHTISPGELYDPLNYQALCAATMNQAGVAPDYPFYAGIGALNIDFNNPTLDLSDYDPGTVGNPPVQPNPDDPNSNPNGDFVFAAVGQLRIHGGLTVSGFSGEVDLFSHLAPVIDPGAVFTIASPASLGLDSDALLSLGNVQFYVSGGSLSLDGQMGVTVNNGSFVSAGTGIFVDGGDITIDNATLRTDMYIGKGVVINAWDSLTLNAADIRPRDTISLWAASIDSTGGTLQTSIGGIFADAGSGITINGGSWSSAVNLQLSAPSISTIGLTASANQSIDFMGDTTLVQGGSLTTYDPLGVGVWIRGNTSATVDGATINSARDANVHGGQITLINATINVNNTDPMPQIFVNGSGPVSIQGSTLAGTGPVNIQGLTLDLLNGQITSGSSPGYNQISLMATDPAALLNVNGTALNSQQIRMQADTIRLENINFPSGSMVDLDCRLGILAPNANTRATIMPGAVNYYDGVKYGGALLDNTPHPNINIH
ncbi:MAG TPA: FecR domain-containing protein [Verrucomicrobiae bacterium]|nr:FecR domain-containing protein [Verrucomicrobiae bacterium]